MAYDPLGQGPRLDGHNQEGRVHFRTERDGRCKGTLDGEAGGVKSEWDTETTEWAVNERGAWRSTGGTFTGIGSMTLNPSETGTKATFMMDYDLPYSILGKIIDKLRVCKAVEKGTTRALRKLKILAEAGNQGKLGSKLLNITSGEGVGGG